MSEFPAAPSRKAAWYLQTLPGKIKVSSVVSNMSRFVSGGTADAPTERDDEWLKAQQELEANRRREEDESKEQEGKSLFEVLQANKGRLQTSLLYKHWRVSADHVDSPS